MTKPLVLLSLVLALIQYAYGDKKVPTPAEELIAYEIELTEPSLIQALSRPEPLVRQNAAILLGRRSIRPAVPQLRRLLEDEFIYARLAAAEALGRLGDPSGPAALVKALQANNNPTVIYAASSLSELGNASGYEAVERISRDSKNAMDRLQAVRALSKFLRFRDKKPLAVDSLANGMLSDPAQPVRLAAAEELKTLRWEDVKRVFEKASKSSDKVISDIAEEYLRRNR